MQNINNLENYCNVPSLIPTPQAIEANLVVQALIECYSPIIAAFRTEILRNLRCHTHKLAIIGKISTIN